jgi:putative oxidoreductase
MHDLIGTSPEGLPRVVGWALLLLRVALAAFFVFAAARNLAGDEQMATDFARWGYPAWFRASVAVLQVVGGVLLLLPASAPWGAAVLSVVLVGAVGTHLVHDPPASALAPLPFLAAAVTIFLVHRPPLLR